jgi:NarL family two-component system response regulator LiaR
MALESGGPEIHREQTPALGAKAGERGDGRMIGVLIVDDDPLVRTLLAEIVNRESDIAILGSATDGLDAVGKAIELKPDVILMDVAMPRLDGLAAMARLAEIESPANVLIFTQDADEELVMQAIRRGAKGYMPKDAPVERIPKAIRALAAGEAWVERKLTGRVFAELARMARQLASHCSPEALLSEREKEVIRLIACGKTNTEIASHLFLSPHTVKSHVSHILQKLDLPNRTEVAIFAVRAGLADTPR